ncbi:MAG: radical SAM family heme chaperone HemW [Bacteroides sp.]|nr:radical SAM family heme chaperone HemW [Bacteroides sp.]
MAGLYIHIPFCLSKCPYCDFYSVGCEKETVKKYSTAVINNLLHYGGSFDTVYFGGGTPILLWREICEMLMTADIDSGAEITVEANPCCTDREKLTALRKAGVNRISFGVQSLDDGELKRLGRRHNSETAVRAVELAFDCGFDNISADIMLGTEGQTLESASNTVVGLSRLPLTHISAYMLKIEENTPFAKAGLELPSEDEVCDIYLNTVGLLGSKGFKQYEISNFARDGFECGHNLKYWNCEEYLGIGPSAHSCLKGKRFFVKRDLEGFCSAAVQKTYIEDESPAGPEEYAMLRLRLCGGLDLNEYEKRGGSAETVVKRIKELPSELVLYKDGSVSLTPKGFLISNAVIGKLLGY